MLQMLKTQYVTAAALGLILAGSALAAAPLQHKSATMQCADRRLAIEADCFVYAGSTTLCSRQSIRFFSADGKVLGARVFPARPLEGSGYPAVDEQFGEISCVETQTKQKFVVASMGNGGNCELCEWFDVYSLDGNFVGSTRYRKKSSTMLDSAIGALYDKSAKRVLNHQSLSGFYEGSAVK